MAHGFRHRSSHRSGVIKCPMYFTYLNQAKVALATANHYRKVGNLHHMSVWHKRSIDLKTLAQAERSKCSASRGYGAMYGEYGGCGHCGDSHSYGAGCGTFLRIAVKDPDKKMCILEKKIKKYKKCCTSGCFLKRKDKQCRKLRKAKGELQTILNSEGGPTTLATATDMAYQKVRTNIDTGEQTLSERQAQTQRTLLITAVSAVGLLTAVYLLRR
jgi:hypothetical protein